jgi:hypothetical protein
MALNTERRSRWKEILRELSRHAPFTALGAITGIIIMVGIVFGGVPRPVSETVFYVLHPAHVVLSALVTTAIYRLHRGKGWAAVLIGFTGSIGIATLSDMFLPYLGGVLFGAKMEFHVGFIEKWWLVNPLAFLGIAIAYWRPTTKLPHAGHVLLSTWASLFYLTAFGEAHWVPLLGFVFLMLFLAVLLPCCLSDIIYPLLFVRGETDHSMHHHG